MEYNKKVSDGNCSNSATSRCIVRIGPRPGPRVSTRDSRLRKTSMVRFRPVQKARRTFEPRCKPRAVLIRGIQSFSQSTFAVKNGGAAQSLPRDSLRSTEKRASNYDTRNTRVVWTRKTRNRIETASETLLERFFFFFFFEKRENLGAWRVLARIAVEIGALTVEKKMEGTRSQDE